MKRRDFLTLWTTVAGSAGFLTCSSRAERLLLPGKSHSPRTLVVVELAGGCDGFNTLIPYRSELYYQYRPNLAIPRREVLELNGEIGFHPAMTALKALFDDGKLAVVQGVGCPAPARSHFQSRLLWHTGRLDPAFADGWLASCFKSLQTLPVFWGVSIGEFFPRAMQSSGRDFGATRRGPKCKPNTATADGNPGSLSDKARAEFHRPGARFVGPAARVWRASDVSLLVEGRDRYRPAASYPDTNLGHDLRSVARLMAADLGLQVFWVTLEGFDTHADQATVGQPMEGMHARLLSSFSDASRAFFADLRQLGRDRDTLLVVFSEFGRTLRENGRIGTDHGTSNPLILIGSSVVPGLAGRCAGLTADYLDSSGDPVNVIDFRSVYATVISRWLGGDPAVVLGGAFQQLDLLAVDPVSRGAV